MVKMEMEKGKLNASPSLSRRHFMYAFGGAATLMAGTAFFGCKKDETPVTPDTPDTPVVPDEPVELTYDELSEKIYMAALGDFYNVYQTALAQDDDDARHAYMAASEAKLLASAAYIPTQSFGGNFAISRVAPYSVDYTLWGNDNYRYHNALVATEPITKAHRDTIRAQWNETHGTGTFTAWLTKFLADNGYTLKDTYNIGYSSEPETWDVLATSRSADSEAIINTYDGLMEYDNEGVLQPALALSYDVSEDGMTYTYHLRQGAKWVDSQGREVADVKADDFVAGMQHMMDAKGGLEYLVQGLIVNADEYITGKVTDFAEVGVAAPDDSTVVFSLVQKASYFPTMVGYGVFAPMSRTYFASQGGKFGVEYDTTAADYKYGIDSDHIAYCGPYLVTNHTDQNTIVFSANPAYWNKDGITIKTLTWKFQDGSDVTKTYTDMKSGVLDGATLNPSTTTIAKTAGEPYPFDTYAYVSLTDATSFGAFMNLNRGAWANFNNAQEVVSAQTDEMKARTNAAMQNVHFRRAVAFAFDRGAYNAQDAGEDLKYNCLINSFVPGTFVSLEKATSITVDGKSYTFDAGTFYGEIIQTILDADGVKIKAWDAEQGQSSGYDGWFNAANAQAELAAAVADGLDISAANPSHLDLPYASHHEMYTNKANAMKQSIEAATGGAVIVDMVACADFLQWYNAGYYCDLGSEGNYDLYDVSGWGPDYGDPQTYLDCMLPYYAGYMTKSLGIF